MSTVKGKKGVSEIIGYVLLIVFAVIMGAIVYNYLRTYVPTEPISCPDSVSLYIQDANYCGTNLNLTIRNNGRFDVAGYSILATNSSSQDLATIDLSSYLNETYGGKRFGNTILFNSNNNSFTTGNQTLNFFNVSPQIGTLKSVQIVPVIFQFQNNRNTLARCATAKVVEKNLVCKPPATPCIPKTCNNIVSGGAVCGKFSDGCGGNLNCDAPGCTSPNVCSNGQCIPKSTCIDTCTSLGYQCGTWTICGSSVSCGNNGQCATGTGPYCNSAGQCVSSACGTSSQVCSSGSSQSCTPANGYTGTQTCSSNCNGWNTCVATTWCGDGVVQRANGETCDAGSQNGVAGSGCSSTCIIEPGYTCSGSPSACTTSFSLCSSNCISSNYNSGYCTDPTTCNSGGGTLAFSGNSFCGSGQGRCCCVH